MIDNEKEMFPVVDKDGNILSAITRSEAHGGSMALHPVVHLHLFNSAGQLFLQKRPDWKDIQPGKWDTAVGGHVDLGESVDQALAREVREELGMENLEPQRLGHYVFESRRERELVFVHKAVSDDTPWPDDSELDGGRFWSMDEIAAGMGQGVFTPNFESEFVRFFGTDNNTHVQCRQ